MSLFYTELYLNFCDFFKFKRNFWPNHQFSSKFTRLFEFSDNQQNNKLTLTRSHLATLFRARPQCKFDFTTSLLTLWWPFNWLKAGGVELWLPCNANVWLDRLIVLNNSLHATTRCHLFWTFFIVRIHWTWRIVERFGALPLHCCITFWRCCELYMDQQQRTKRTNIKRICSNMPFGTFHISYQIKNMSAWGFGESYLAFNLHITGHFEGEKIVTHKNF